MLKHEEIIKRYFKCWINNDALILEDIFWPKAIYSECYGPEYQGIEIIKRWFEDWHKRGTVLAWDIKQFIHEANVTAVEWYFKCEYDGKIGEFDGVSLIKFSDSNQIVNVKEFQSKIPHYYPYN